MLDSILGFFGLILVAVYLYAGDKANYYCKYHLLNVRAEVYGNTGDYIVYRIGWAAILGVITIPIALLHYNFVLKGNSR